MRPTCGTCVFLPFRAITSTRTAFRSRGAAGVDRARPCSSVLFCSKSHVVRHRRRQPPIAMSNEREESRRCPARRGMPYQGVREGKASINTDQPTAGTAKEGGEVREVQGLDEEEIRDGLVRSRRRCLSCVLHEVGRETPSENVERIRLRGWQEFGRFRV